MADKIEREIEEILRKIDDFVPEKGGPRRPPPPRRVNSGISNAQGWLARRLAAISLNQVMLWSMLILIAAFLFRGIPGASWIMIGALVVFATAFLLTLRMPGGSRGPEKVWRGEPVSYSGPAWPTRLKGWIKAKRRRR